jgi:anti-sigma regulatory factor (Ser/Thr protein kinase)
MLYTDGITEAENKAGHFYGEDRLLDTVSKAYAGTENTLVSPLQWGADLHEQVRAFTDEFEQSDDQTLLVLRRHQTWESEPPTQEILVNMNGQSDAHAVDDIHNVLQNFAVKYDWPDQTEHDLSLILEEYMVNLQKYAYRGEQNPWLKVSIQQLVDSVEVHLKDNGQSFDPNQHSMPELKDRSSQETPGEHGLLIIRSLAHDVDYQSHGDFNHCVIRYRK